MNFEPLPAELLQPVLQRWACANEVSYIIRAFCELPTPIPYRHAPGQGYGRPWLLPTAVLERSFGSSSTSMKCKSCGVTVIAVI